ncbi:MAG TPA: trypsin-like peptidase domain-containing protein [Opitutaceae bacterium]|nr:trypsin-like peptidase domain-containing protein [Opitutaceae bacterium]
MAAKPGIVSWISRGSFDPASQTSCAVLFASNTTLMQRHKLRINSTRRGFSSILAPGFAIFGILAFFAPNARAIISGSIYNYSDPGSAPWNYVGSLNGASGVYLGDYNNTNWVLTAAHVGLGNFTLGGATYDAIGGSAFSLYNSDGSPSDLSLFQISGAPGLANLTIASSEAASGTTVQMIGFGGGKSWGTNTIAGYTDYTLSGFPYGGIGIVTLASGEGGNGAQGVPGDSGGGMFYDDSGNWTLAGTLSGVGDLTDGNGTDLGQSTVAVDLAAYSSQITADINSVAIPEPSLYAAILGAAVLGFTVVRRKRMPA